MTKLIKPRKKPGAREAEMSAIYDGQAQIGSVSVLHEKGFAAFDAACKCLGVYRSRLDAVKAVLDTARDAGLLDTRDASMKGDSA